RGHMTARLVRHDELARLWQDQRRHDVAEVFLAPRLHLRPRVTGQRAEIEMQEGHYVERALAVVLVVLVEQRDVRGIDRAAPDEEMDPLVGGIAAQQRVV